MGPGTIQPTRLRLEIDIGQGRTSPHRTPIGRDMGLKGLVPDGTAFRAIFVNASAAENLSDVHKPPPQRQDDTAQKFS